MSADAKEAAKRPAVPLTGEKLTWWKLDKFATEHALVHRGRPCLLCETAIGWMKRLERPTHLEQHAMWEFEDKQ